jgi:hypothetical protein
MRLLSLVDKRVGDIHIPQQAFMHHIDTPREETGD